jgi:tetratricopeptide (TPR) repeat protein
MKILIIVVVIALFCIPAISAIDYDVPIAIGRTTPPYTPPIKNPQDCKPLFDNGDYESALQCYSNTTILTPNDAEAWNYKGSALFQMNRLDEALQCFERAILLRSSHVGAWNNKGLILADQGKYEEAIRCYDVAIQINSENMQTWRAKARALDALGRYEEALRCCDIALKLDPTNGETIYFGNSLLERLSTSGKSQQSSEINIENISQEEIKSAGSWIDKGNTLFIQKKFEEALDCYNKAIEFYPQCAPAWNNKATCLINLNRDEDAIDAFDRVLEIDPQDAHVWYFKALVLERLGYYVKANFAVTKAKELGYTG